MIDTLSRARMCLHLVVTCCLLSSCSTSIDGKPIGQVKPQLQEKEYVTYDGDRLGYKKWLPKKAAPKTVIIGVHGISGHAGDYDNLGEFLLKNSPATAFYAAETRGQGLDPKVERRGDIRSEKSWYKDLYTFTDLVRKLYPKSKVIWYGESMGSLIVMHAYNQAPPGSQKPDAVIVSSPIVDVRAKVEPWKAMALRVSAFLMPKLRVSLESLSNGEKAQVTQQDIHEEQAPKNAWYIRRYTLRLLLKLGDLADSMPQQAAQMTCPVLVMHGGKDIFTSEDSVKKFYSRLPDNISKSRKFYPQAFHLLMYDAQREEIFKDAANWIDALHEK